MSREFYINHKNPSVDWTVVTEKFGLLTYDDVLILQENNTELESRIEADTTINFGPYTLLKPIITAPMDTISGDTMIRKMAELGGIGSLPRGDLNARLQLCETYSIEGIPCLYAIGLKDGFTEALQLKHRGAQMILIDVAHGGMSDVQRLAGEIKNKLELCVVAGNITTYEQAESYKKCGIDIARVGVGGGSACTTRIKTGVGFPQLSAIFETTETGIYVIADGGIKYPSDLSKAIAGGAVMGMIGGLFAGTEETPGEVIDGKKFFRGQASSSYMKDNQVVQNGHRTDEGIATSVPFKGAVEHIVNDLMGGLKSSMSYVGTRNIADFQKKAKFVFISSSTVTENKPHILDRT